MMWKSYHLIGQYNIPLYWDGRIVGAATITLDENGNAVEITKAYPGNTPWYGSVTIGGKAFDVPVEILEDLGVILCDVYGEPLEEGQ